MNTKLETQAMVIDIAQYAKDDKIVPAGHHYKIMVDRDTITIDQESMTGREILAKVGKTPIERFQLNQRFKGGKVVKVGYDQRVSFLDPGIEKFMTIPLDQFEG